MITCLDKRYFDVNDLPGEEWCLISDEYNHSKNRKYEVSSKGRVKSTSLLSGKSKILKPYIHPDKHVKIEFVRKPNSPKRQHSVHRLVAEAFIPNPENKIVVHHIDGNPLNNQVDNLMWVTLDEHKEIHGKKPRKYVCLYDSNNNIIGVYNTDDVRIKYLTEEEFNNLR